MKEPQKLLRTQSQHFSLLSPIYLGGEKQLQQFKSVAISSTKRCFLKLQTNLTKPELCAAAWLLIMLITYFTEPKPAKLAGRKPLLVIQ